MKAGLKLWWLLLSILVLVGLSRLRLDVDVLNLLPPELPSVQGLKIYQEHFANARELIITLRAPQGKNTGAFAEALATELRAKTNLVTDVSWQPPWMEQPKLAAEIVAYLWLNQPPETFNSLIHRLSTESRGQVLGEAREILTTSLSPMDIARRAFDPYDFLNLPTMAKFSGLSFEQGEQMFSSSDGAFRIVFVQAQPALEGYRACVEWLGLISQAVDKVRLKNPEWRELTIRYTGRPAFVAEIASSMQRDLSGSIIGTAIIIALLFWLTHRRWLPMLWLLALLGFILISTLGLGSLILGPINVISLGFAAILLGLAVDYAVVHYQEALSHPNLSVPEIRRAISPSIIWAAITTISAFMMLNLGSLPGLAQLGTLVAIGVSLAAMVMVLAFLPPLFPSRRRLPPGYVQPGWRSFIFPQATDLVVQSKFLPSNCDRLGLPITLLVIIGFTLALGRGRIEVDRSGNALRLQHTEAETALDEITTAVGIPQDPLWTIAVGQTESDVYDQFIQAETILAEARTNHFISGYLVPTDLWPQENHQTANRSNALWLAEQGTELQAAALKAGFTTDSLFLTDELLRTWNRLGHESGVSWPTNTMSQWLLKRFVAHTKNQWFGLGVVYAETNQINQMPDAGLSRLAGKFEKSRILLSGWPLLGSITLSRVKDRLWLILVPMVALVLVSLWLAFRKLSEVLLGVAVLLMSGLCLLTFMAMNGWKWNLLNLMGIPLILGTGVDYGIFIQLGLRRHGGDVQAVRQSIGRALLLCGGTAIAGFGALAWSANVGMASLGKVCAVGIFANMLIAIYLLPSWWLKAMELGGQMNQGGIPNSKLPRQPSIFYRAWLWRVGMLVSRLLPVFLLRRISLSLAMFLFRADRNRREVVIGNLLPVVQGDRVLATEKARQLYRQFALKLLDLWRFESGLASAVAFQKIKPYPAMLSAECPEDRPFHTLIEAKQKKRGVLLLTPHLGNWEVGAILLKNYGISLLVLTQAEPGNGLTELRQKSRARWGIETLVIGNDAFAFIEVIRRLQEGEVVALLVDRPQPASAVEVQLFDQPFLASIAPAELARASGCALLGVTILRCPDGRYEPHFMAEFEYDRRLLGKRSARHELTKQIIRAFEPKIRQHLDQWFHFVPIWPQKRANPEN